MAMMRRFGTAISTAAATTTVTAASSSALPHARQPIALARVANSITSSLSHPARSSSQRTSSATLLAARSFSSSSTTSTAATSSSPALHEQLRELGVDVDALDATTLRELEQLDLSDVLADADVDENGDDIIDDAEDEIDAKLLARLRAYRVHGKDGELDADEDADGDEGDNHINRVTRGGGSPFVDEDAIAASRASALREVASTDMLGDFDPLDDEFVATDELRLNNETGEVELDDDPTWLHSNTRNPEWIPPLRQPGQVDAPASAPYPTVPVLRTTRDLKEASLLHRLLQYTRLNSARTFLRLERKRRELEHQRRYRNLYALNLRAPPRRVDLDDPKVAKPAVKNLPSNLSPAHLAVYHPHVITTDVEWIDDVMTFLKNELTVNATMSSAEKVKMLKVAHRMLLRCYWLMMKDKASGYYRITLGSTVRKAVPVDQRKSKRVYSSVLDEILCAKQ